MDQPTPERRRRQWANPFGPGETSLPFPDLRERHQPAVPGERQGLDDPGFDRQRPGAAPGTQGGGEPPGRGSEQLAAYHIEGP
ncbi:MAG: hypothetical protein L3K08_02455, partial [Thermoplasmata archaeon]|nr:hypothetical protein [Thermoplasmata archaeon]